MKRAQCPETAHEAAEWSRRRGDYLKSGVGGPNCAGIDCASAGAYLSGTGYGESPDACSWCAALMASWPTRPVARTGFKRVPRGGLTNASGWLGSSEAPGLSPAPAASPTAEAVAA